MKTIVYAHPWEGSYNHAILTTLIDDFSAKKENFQVLDLCQEKFDPVFSKEELSLYNKGISPYPLVNDYQKKLQATTELIFIFPIWWYDVPAILKGFLDKVMLRDFAFAVDEKGALKGKLTHIKKTTVISTSAATLEFLQNEGGNFIQKVLIEQTLNACGIQKENSTWIHFAEIETTSAEKRTQFLQELPTKL